MEDKPFDSEKVDEIIKKEKDYLASHEKQIVESLTVSRGLVTVDEGDKALARIDAMFLPERKIEVDGEMIPAYRSFL